MPLAGASSSIKLTDLLSMTQQRGPGAARCRDRGTRRDSRALCCTGSALPTRFTNAFAFPAIDQPAIGLGTALLELLEPDEVAGAWAPAHRF